MISIICPSRDRPNELKTALDSLGLKKNGLEALVWLDDDDPQLNKYHKLFDQYPNVKLFIKKRVGYKDFHLMLNFLCQQAKFDWIFEFNDDAYMENPDWFAKFKDFARQFEPTNQPIVLNPWCAEDLNYNDFPIASRKFIELLGHFSLFPACDTWVQAVALRANITYLLHGMKPIHRKKGENALRDQTFVESQNAIRQLRRTHNPKRSPFRQQIKEDAAKIIAYNMSTKPAELCQKIKTVGFIGLGKLGLPIAEAIAKRGFNVLGHDVRKINTTLPLAKSIKEIVDRSDLVFCAVPTPHESHLEGDKPLPKIRSDFDYSYLIKVIKEIARVNKKTNLAVISTCLPGTYKIKIKPLLNANINYLYNPFFIAMGTVVEDFLNPEFVLIAGNETAILKHFYTKIHGQDKTFVTDITTAEGIKVFYNTFITTKTVLGNMYGEFAHKLGMNVDDIYSALTRATNRLISPRYLKSGVGDGGSCHPRDNIALSHLAKKMDLSFNLFDALMEAREKHMEWLADIFKEEIKRSGLPGIVLGKSFKPSVDLQTGSAAILLANILKGKKVEFEHYEFEYPELKKAVYFIATQHEQYANINFPKGSVVIDPFRYIDGLDGVEVISIGGLK